MTFINEQTSPQQSNVALFLDLDNLVIGASEAGLPFDIQLILESLESYTGGRIVLRKAYGDWRAHQGISRALASAGFDLQSVVRLNNSDKNVADMILMADAMETLLDQLDLHLYILMTGDRDFIPLVKLLRRRGKQVIAVGLRASTSQSLADLCDGYLYYDDLVRDYHAATIEDVQGWIRQAAEIAFSSEVRVQASVFKEIIQQVSVGRLSETPQGKLPFGQMLEFFPELIQPYQDGTVLYVYPTDATLPIPSQPIVSTHSIAVTQPSPIQQKGLSNQQQEERLLRNRYRSELKKIGLRVVSPHIRLLVLKDVIRYFSSNPTPVTQQLFINSFVATYERVGQKISKSKFYDILRVAGRAGVIDLPENRTADELISFTMEGDDDLYRRAVITVDKLYLRKIQSLDLPYDLNEAAMALYDTEDRLSYLQYIHELLAN